MKESDYVTKKWLKTKITGFIGIIFLFFYVYNIPRQMYSSNAHWTYQLGAWLTILITMIVSLSLIMIDWDEEVE